MLDADTTTAPPPADDAVATTESPQGLPRITALRELLTCLAGEAIADTDLQATDAIAMRDGFRDLEAMLAGLHNALRKAADELSTGTGELSMDTIEAMATALDVAQAPSGFGPKGGC